jgi:hypothetical protein
MELSHWLATGVMVTCYMRLHGMNGMKEADSRSDITKNFPVFN